MERTRVSRNKRRTDAEAHVAPQVDAGPLLSYREHSCGCGELRGPPAEEPS